MKAALMVAATALLAATGSAAQSGDPARLRFEPHTLRLGDGTEIAVERGTLRVPERRSARGSDSIELAVIRLPAKSPRPGAPILYLNGDPGAMPASRVLQVAALHPAFDRLRESGDVLVMDYRGSGLSRPQLRCAAGAPPSPEVLRSREEMLAVTLQAARSCREHLESQGIDLYGYTWVEVADDVRDLADALGVARLRLFGFSSGTHAALATIRRHEARVERAVLVGTEGMDHTRKLPSGVDRQIERIGRLAASDSSLNGQVHDLPALMDRVLRGLETHPVPVEVELSDGTRLTGSVGRHALEFITSKSLSGPEEFAILPRLYHSLSRGDTSVLTGIVRGIAGRPLVSPLSHLMDGSSGVSAERRARIEAEAKESLLRNAVNFPFPEIRAAWGYADLGEPYRVPVRAATPVLFVTGELDGNTPPEQAEDVRRGFPNSFHLVIGNGGHGSAFTSPEAVTAMLRFLDQGNPPAGEVVLPRPRFVPLAR